MFPAFSQIAYKTEHDPPMFLIEDMIYHQSIPICHHRVFSQDDMLDQQHQAYLKLRRLFSALTFKSVVYSGLIELPEELVSLPHDERPIFSSHSGFVSASIYV